jgi:hypothetical protein
MPSFTDTHPDYSDSYESMLDNLDQPDEFELTNWEADFLDSMLKQNSLGRTLSDKQAETIRNLADKYLSK